MDTKKILNVIHLPRRVRVQKNGQLYYHSIFTDKLKKIVRLNENNIPIQEKLIGRKIEETFDYIIIGGKRQLSSYTKDKKIYTQKNGTPWIISTLKKVFGDDKKLKTLTTKEYAAPYYHMRPCTKGTIDTYEGGKIVSTQDISGQR